jgi:hypothetical protein
MSYNGSGTFNINTTGQPVVAGTVISSSAFNSLTSDLATGLSTAITKDGQTTTTARITFAQGITSSLVTDSSSVSTGSIITDGGMGVAKNLYVGGTLNVTGSTSLTNPVINNIKMGYTTTATAAGTTTLTVASNYRQFFTGTTTQTIVLPVTSTLVTGIAYEIENNSTGLLTVNSSGGNLVGTVPAGVCAHAVCIGTTLTTAADWDWDYISTTTITGTGANVLGTSPTITTPTISSLSSASATALTLQSAGTTAITVDTSQNVGIGTSSPANRLDVVSSAVGVMKFTASGAKSGWLYSDSGGVAFSDTADFSKNGLYIQNTSNYVAVYTGSTGAERMRIDSSGNVGIGVTPNTSNQKTIELGASGNVITTNGANDIQIAAGGYYNSGWKYAVTGSAVSNYYQDNGIHVWRYAASGTTGNTITWSEAARIDSNGCLCLGTTSQYGSNILSIQKSLASSGSGAGTLINVYNNGATSTTRTYNSVMRVASNASSADCNIVITDNIAYNYFFGGTSGTAYVTVSNNQGVKLSAGGTSWAADSDERLKNIKEPITNALANLETLRTVRGNFKTDTDDVSRLFLIAQDVQKVYPEAIDVYTDEQQTLGLRAVDLIPVLVASIKELKALNDSLTARIVALESK